MMPDVWIKRRVEITCSVLLGAGLVLSGCAKKKSADGGEQEAPAEVAAVSSGDAELLGGPDRLEETVPESGLRDWQAFEWDELSSVEYGEREELLKWAYDESRLLKQEVVALQLDRMNDSGVPFEADAFEERHKALYDAILQLRETTVESWPDVLDALAEHWSAADEASKQLYESQ